MINRRQFTVLAGLSFFALIRRELGGDASVLAGPRDVCEQCGAAAGCQRSCRLVMEEKKVTITCWGSQAEDFCLPLKGQPCQQHCELVCDEGPDGDALCVKPKKFVWTEWIPGCGAKPYTKQKLMKKTITKKVPSYKWVVETLCDECRERCPSVEAPPGAEVPLPPVINVKR